MNQVSSQAENFDKKILSKKVKDIDKAHVTKGKFLAYNYIGDHGDGARAILVEQDKNQPDKVRVEVTKITPNESWITEYYIVLDQESGAIVNQTEKADFMAFDYEYIPWDDGLHLELRFWFDYQEVVVLEVNLWSQIKST